MRHRFGVFTQAAALLLLFAAPLAQAQTNMYLDFDDDNDPWTLRQDLPVGVTHATVKFVLEVGENPPLGAEVWGAIDEGCCNWVDYMHYYGTLAVWNSIQFNPVYFTGDIGFPTCLECCPSAFYGQIAASAPVVPGQRYFVGQADWDAFCDQPCAPLTEFTFTLSQGIGGMSHMVFRCPGMATESRTWGRLKSVYR